MDNRSEVREFLTSRRAKITPEQAQIPQAGHRRVAGLRRSEVATLAGMSVEYYARLERGPSPASSPRSSTDRARPPARRSRTRPPVHLAQAADGTSAARRPRGRNRDSWTVRPSLQWTLDSITAAPAIVGNNRSDLLATNHLGRALYADLSSAKGAAQLRPVHLFDSAAHRFFPDWDLAADMTVANLRTGAGQDPYDKSLHDLVGELSTRSDEFRRRWGAHNVRTHGTGVKHFHHHVVGDLALAYESLDLRAEPGLTMTIYAAEPGSPTAHALALLASWAATQPTELQARS